MNTQLEESNYIEQLYKYNLIEIIKYIVVLIEGKKNQQDYLNGINEIYNYNIEKYNIEKYISPYQNSKWHDYLIGAQYALSGDYVDEECESHGIFHGKKMLAYLKNELVNFPTDILEDIMIYIYDHIDLHKCILCN